MSGVNFYSQYALVNVKTGGLSASPPIILEFQNGVTVESSDVFLNMPLSSLLNLNSDSILFSENRENFEKFSCSNNQLTVYLVYDDAWWFTKLGISSGNFELSDPPLRGSFRQSSISCQAGTCNGALLVYFGSNSSEIDYYTNFVKDEHQTLTILPPENPLLSSLHNALLFLFSKSLMKMNISSISIEKPRLLFLAKWLCNDSYHPAVSLIEKEYQSDLALIQKAIMKPLSTINLFVVNQAWTGSIWAEDSLLMAESILNKFYALNRPSWLDQDYYNQTILNTI